MNGMRKKGRAGLLLKELYQLNTVFDLVCLDLWGPDTKTRDLRRKLQTSIPFEYRF